MRAGHGRGYYGVGQLAPEPPRRRGSGWVKLALVVGVGTVIWLMWPRSQKFDPQFGGSSPQPPSPPAPPLDQAQLQLAQPGQAGQAEQLAQTAQSRGYPSQQAYEDAVVDNARQLQATGAKVMLAPHLQHLSARLLP